jgi:hypothetical protein
MAETDPYRYSSLSSSGEDSANTSYGSSDAADGESTSPRRRRVQKVSSEFLEPLVPLQLKLPADLVSSLKLLAFSNRESISEIALRCLTTSETIPKVWLSRRGA